MRNFDDIIKSTREDLKESEALILRLNKKPLSEADVNHGNMPALAYAKAFGFDTDEYTKEEKYLLAVNMYCYAKAAHLRACCRRRLGMGD